MVIVLIAAVTALVTALAGRDSGHTLRHILGNTSVATALLLPVLGVLLVTSEWSQRTALTTFTLVPRRGRIIIAKMLAGLVLAVAAAIMVAAVAAAAATVAPHGPGPHPATWHGAMAVIAYSLPFQVLNLLLGVGFGLLFLNTPVAVVVYFVIPTGWAILTSSISAMHAAGNWFDPSTAWGHLTGATVTGTTWAQVGASAAVWILLPVAAGSARVLRSMIS